MQFLNSWFGDPLSGGMFSLVVTLGCVAATAHNARAQDADPSAGAISQQEELVLAAFCNDIESMKSGTAEEKRAFWGRQSELRLPELKTDEARAKLYRLYGDHATSQGDKPEAIRVYKILVEKYSSTREYPAAMRELADLAGRENDYASLLGAASGSLAQTDDPSQKISINQKMAEALIGLAEYTQAVALMERLTADFPEHRSEVSKALSYIGAHLIARQQFEQGRELLELSYSATPPNERTTTLLANLATASTTLGKKEEALKYHQEAKLLAGDGRAAAYDFTIANLLFELGRFDESKTHYQAVLDSQSSLDDLPNLKKLAAENLENIAVRTSNPSLGEAAFKPVKAGRANRIQIIVIVNLVFAAIVLSTFVFRRRDTSKGNAP
jgi:tetratricopeptide (TPR) repeat protein